MNQDVGTDKQDSPYIRPTCACLQTTKNSTGVQLTVESLGQYLCPEDQVVVKDLNQPSPTVNRRRHRS